MINNINKMSMFNKFSSGENIDIISSDITSNLSDTTTTRNRDSTKNIESGVTSRVDRTSTDPNSGGVNVNINAGVVSNDIDTKPPSTPPSTPPSNKDDNSGDSSDKILGMNKTLFYILIVILILLGIGGGYMYFKNQKSKSFSNRSSVGSMTKSPL